MSSVTSPCGERSLGHAIVRVQVLFRDNGTSVVQGGGSTKVRAMQHMKNKKIVIIKPVTKEEQGS